MLEAGERLLGFNEALDALIDHAFRHEVKADADVFDKARIFAREPDAGDGDDDSLQDDQVQRDVASLFAPSAAQGYQQLRDEVASPAPAPAVPGATPGSAPGAEESVEA